MRRQFIHMEKTGALICVEGLLNSSCGRGTKDSSNQLSINIYLLHAHSVLRYAIAQCCEGPK